MGHPPIAGSKSEPHDEGLHDFEWTNDMPIMILAALSMMLAMQTPDARVADLPAKPIPVAVLCNGDDGLTARLCDDVKQDFSKLPDFTLKIAHEKHILIVRIPTNVSWKKVNGRTKVLYKVEFSLKDDHDLGDNDGSCWEHSLNDCALQVVSKTRRALGQTQ